jgi:ribosomal protein L17
MKLIALLAVVVAVTASSINVPRSEWLNELVSEKLIEDTEFLANREYKFFYNGQLSTGIPSTSPQHSATRVQALVSLIFQSDDVCVMQMLETRFGRRNDELTQPREIIPFAAFEQLEIEEHLVEKLRKPVKFIYRNGMINEIEFDRTEQPWSANIKRGVLNLLQVNLVKKNEINRVESALRTEIDEIERKRDSFTAMESTLEGECETEYTFESTPCVSTPLRQCRDVETPVLNVTKSINFERCNIRPEIRYNERFSQICPNCEDKFETKEKLLRSSTVGNLNLICKSSERKSCLIERSTIVSQYNFVPFTEQDNMITTYVKQTLELVKTSDIESEIPELSDPIKSDSNLIFTQEWDLQKEMFQIKGEQEFQTNTPYSELPNKVEFISKIVRKMINHMTAKVDEEAPRHFTRLVKVLRMLKKEEIKECHQKIFKSAEGYTREEHKKIQDLFIDAIALCGTKDCLDQLVHSIEKNEITTIKASMAIKKLMDARIVSVKMIEKLMTICKSDKCERSAVLKQSVYLTVGSMMRTLCVDTRDKWAVEQITRENKICPTEFEEKFIQKIAEEFENTESEYTRVLLLKTLSNAGLRKTIRPVERIIIQADRKYSTNVRIEAILALRQLTSVMPKKVINVLLPVYINSRELSEVRIACLYQIMECQPEKPILDQIARQMTVERSHQVTSYTFTLLQTLANSTSPFEQRIASDLKLSLRMGKYVPVSRWIGSSKSLRLVDYYCPKSRMGLNVDMSSVFTNSSVLPNTFAINMNTIGGGAYYPRVLSIGFRQSGLGRSFNRLVRSYSHNMQTSLNDLLSGKFEIPSNRFNYREELKTLFENLNTVDRSELDTEAFGSLYLKSKNMEYGFLPLTKEFIPEELIELINSEESSINKIVKRAERLLKDVAIPFSFHTASFGQEMIRKIPTTLGMPLRVSIKMPTIMQASGVLKVEVDSQNPLKKIKVILDDFKPSMVVTHVTKVEAWSPIVNTGVKVLAQAKVYAPIDASLVVDMKKSPAEIKFAVAPKLAREEEIVTVQTRPISFTIVWPRRLEQWVEPQEKTIHGEEWTRVNTHNVQFGERVLGIKMHLRAQWHRTPAHRVPTTPFSTLAGVNKYTLTMQPGHEMPKEFVVRLSGRYFNSFDKKSMTPKFDKFFEDSSENFLSRESSEERDESIISDDYTRTFKGRYPVSSEIELEIYTTGSSIKRKCVVGINLMCDDQMKTCNSKIEVERTPIPSLESKPWRMECNLKMLYPKTPFTINEITSDKRFMCEIDAKWGSENNMDKKLRTKIVAEQSTLMLKLKDQSSFKRLSNSEEHRNTYPSIFSPVAQYSQTLRWGLLDEYKMDIDYELPTFERRLINKVYRHIQNYFYRESVIRDLETSRPEGHIRAKFNIDPVNRRYLNVTVQTPTEELFLEDIALPMETSFMNMRRVSTPSRSFSHLLRQLLTSESSVCEIRTNRMRTFDDVKYDVPTSTCYTVLAKDCRSAQLSKFAVLIKKQDNTSEKKTLKIVTPTVKLIIRSVEENQLECELNGEKKECTKLRNVVEHNDHTILSCRQHIKNLISCELPEAGLRVYFDGLSANIKVSPIYRSQVCGLCGQFDLNTQNEWTSSRREIVDRRSMFESFLVEKDNCEHEMPEHNTVLSFDDERFENLPESSTMVVRSSEHEVRPIEKTNIMEQGHELCFSRKPVKVCPRHTHAIKYETKKVVYSCLRRNTVQAEIFERQARYENVIVSEVEDLPTSFTESKRVPKICRQH